jgi:hypothetical protein
MTNRDHSSGGLTGATGDLTPDDIQRDFEPGEWREASDAEHQAEVTRSQASHARHELSSSASDEPFTDADEAPAEQDPREPQIGGDERADHEEHL